MIKLNNNLSLINSPTDIFWKIWIVVSITKSWILSVSFFDDWFD